MSDDTNRRVNRGPQTIGALIGSVIAPVCAKRGFATADLIAAWSDIVGPRYATTTMPEKLTWPRRDQAKAPGGATLVIRVDSGMAIYLQHETAVLLDRTLHPRGAPASVLAFLGLVLRRPLVTLGFVARLVAGLWRQPKVLFNSLGAICRAAG